MLRDICISLFFLELIIFCLSLFIMEINDRFKKVIFKKLYNDLSHVEIIPYEKSIWFVGRNNKYWYLELKYNGHLWWRLNFFQQFFQAFSLDRIDYEPIIAEWVEEVLNHKVNAAQHSEIRTFHQVEKVLNHKVNAALPDTWTYRPLYRVEEVLNHKVVTTGNSCSEIRRMVEEVLNHKVVTTMTGNALTKHQVEEVLNHKVVTTKLDEDLVTYAVEDVLNHKVITIIDGPRIAESKVEEVLNHKVNTISHISRSVMNVVEKVLNTK